MDLQSASVLVTGANGFIGKYVVSALLKRGCDSSICTVSFCV